MNFLLVFAAILLIIIFALNRSRPQHLIVRHGEREDATNPSWTSQHPYDTPITENAEPFEKLFRQRKDYFASLPPKSFILCSPFKRCIQTAKIINSRLPSPLPIIIEPGLVEYSSLEFFLGNQYFSPTEIKTRFSGVETPPPVYSPYDLEILYRKIRTEPRIMMDELKKKLDRILSERPGACICVAHREFINISDPSAEDGYCSSVLI